MIHELQEYTKAGFEFVFYYVENHGMMIDVWIKDTTELVYCQGWCFGEACVAMDKYLKEKNNES